MVAQSQATFGPWSKWTPCSKTCDTGRKSRRRKCDVGPKSSEVDCKGMLVEIEKCIIKKCPGEWAQIAI